MTKIKFRDCKFTSNFYCGMRNGYDTIYFNEE